MLVFQVMSGDSDADRCRQLVAAIEAGDGSAEQSLVECFGKPIALLLDRQTRGRPEAEDLFQESFRLALIKIRAGEVRDASKLPAFLGQLARHLAIEHYRKQARRKTDTVGDAMPELQTAAQAQFDQLAQREDAVLTRQLLGELRNVRDREVLVRFYLVEEEREQIADDLGITVGQFNRVLHRARQRYRVLFAASRRAVGAVMLLIQLLLALPLARRSR